MRIAIVGAGAMGSLFTGFFSREGNSLLMLEKDPAVIKEIGNGLTIRDRESQWTIHPEITSDSSQVSDADIIFLFVKSHATRDAVVSVKDHVRTGILVTLQNGIGNREIIEEYLPRERVVCGTTTIGASKFDPSTVIAGGMGDTVIGGGSAESLETVRSLLERSGLNVETTDDPDRAVWKKAIINAAINPLGALLKIKNGDILNNPFARQIMEEIILESVRVSGTLGMEFDGKTMIGLTREVCRKTSENYCSMLQDVLAGRRTEIDSINGAIVDRSGNPSRTPWNRAMVQLLRSFEFESEKKVPGLNRH